MNKVVLYQKAKTGKTKVWSSWVIESGYSGHPEINYEWGLTDGKSQLTSDIIAKGVNEGKANETTPFEQAILTWERKIKKKKEEGYTESLEETVEVKSINPEDFFPKELCFYKPKNSLPDNKLDSLSRPVFTVKRDGMMHVARKVNDRVEIYSRRMDLVTDKYPHIVEALSKVKEDFVLLGEMILDIDGKDDFNGVSQICRSDGEKAIARQEEIGWVSYYLFDIAFIDGDNLLTSSPYIDRLNIIDNNIIGWLESDSPIQLCETLNYNIKTDLFNDKTHEEALKEVQDRDLEGLVVWDADGVMDKKYAFTFSGKAGRPNVLWKSKPKYEDDFIVDFDPENGIGEYGKGKNNGRIKSAFIYQMHEDEWVFLGKCGGGLSDEQRDFYTNDADYPRVWQIEFDSIQEKTGSLRFPVFKADRTLIGDKDIDECWMSDKIKKAREEI